MSADVSSEESLKSAGLMGADEALTKYRMQKDSVRKMESEFATLQALKHRRAVKRRIERCSAIVFVILVIAIAWEVIGAEPEDDEAFSGEDYPRNGLPPIL